MNNDPEWRVQLAAALHRNRHESSVRYLQLATVDSQGYPQNRTLVFRGFLKDTDHLQFATDARSQKIDQIQHHPHAQVCWYFSKTREQFRLTGLLRSIQANGNPTLPDYQIRIHLWEAISKTGKLLWYWPTPKAPQAPVSEYITDLPAVQDPPETFVVLLLDPVEVDHLQLRGDLVYPQTRHLYTWNGENWQCCKVNP
jgi:PPOX class probable FMN-dependent enzyme